MSRRALPVIIGVTASLALFACAGSGGQPAETPVAADRVDMPRSYRFAPTAIAVPVGATVTWSNSDQFTHSVQLLQTDVDLVARPGESVTYTFDQAGLYPYTCTFHPTDMSGSVLVTDS
jgi:plastocyanin